MDFASKFLSLDSSSDWSRSCESEKKVKGERIRWVGKIGFSGKFEDDGKKYSQITFSRPGEIFSISFCWTVLFGFP